MVVVEIHDNAAKVIGGDTYSTTSPVDSGKCSDFFI